MQIYALHKNTYTPLKEPSKENDETLNNEENSQKAEQKSNELSQSEKAQIRQLQSIDTKVKAHEMAHIAAGGGLTGAAQYSYVRGPDNKMYAVAGEVSIDMRKGNSPEESIANARQIQAAALAPSDPSPQDYKVAAAAVRMELQARAELNKIKLEENKARQKEQEQKNEEQGLKNNEHNQKANSYTDFKKEFRTQNALNFRA